MSKQTDHGGVFLWYFLIALFLEYSAVVVFVPPATIRQVISDEVDVCVRHLSEEACREVADATKRYYKAIADDTGWREATYRYFITNFDETYNAVENLDDRGMGQLSLRLLQSTWGALYIILWRFSLMSAWAPWFFALGLGCVIDAYVSWRISHYRFSFQSPLIHHTAFYVLVGVGCGFLCVLVLPFTITPLWVPTLIGIALVSAWLMIKNLNKRV